MIELKPTAWLKSISELKTESALNPTLLFLLIVTPLALILTAISRPPISFGLMVIAATPVFVAALQIVGFSVFAPTRLQNEKHLERKEAMAQRVAIREGGRLREFEVNQQKLISNPASKQSDQE